MVVVCNVILLFADVVELESGWRAVNITFWPLLPGFVGLLGADRLFYHHPETLTPSLQPVRELKGPVGQIVAVDHKNIVAVEQNKVGKGFVTQSVATVE